MIDWSGIRRKHVGGYDSSKVPAGFCIPVMPQGVMQFAAKAEDPDVTGDDLAKTIENDTTLTCELLRHVNSSALGLRKRVNTAARAINLLGIHRSKMLLLTSAVERAMKPQALGSFDYTSFLNCNIERGLFAQQIATSIGQDGDLAFAAAMLCDSLLPAAFVDANVGASYVGFLQTPVESRTRLKDFEEKTHGWNHAAVAGQIMLGWNFPDDLVCCVSFHHHFAWLLSEPDLKRSPAYAVALAALLPDSLLQEPKGIEALFRVARASQAFDPLAIAEEIAPAFDALATRSAASPHVALSERLSALAAEAC